MKRKKTAKAEVHVPIKKPTEKHAVLETTRKKTVTSRVVKWLDSWSDYHKDSRYTLDDTSNFAPLIRYSCGLAIYEDSNCVVLAQNFFQPFGTFSQLILIPKDCIIGDD